MAVLLFLPVSIIALNFLSNESVEHGRRSKIFMVISVILITFVMGLRNMASGMDTKVYSAAFEAAAQYASLWEYLDRADVFANGFLMSEAGFSVFVWLLSRVFSYHRYFLLAVSLLVSFCVGRFAWKNSQDSLTSLMVFLCLGMFQFCMSAIRQSIAMAICLLAYEHVKNRKPVRFALTVLLAMLFHKSAIVFFVVYFVYYLKFNWRYIVVAVGGLALFVAFADEIATLYNDMMLEDYDATDSFESGGFFVILIYALCIVAALVFNRKMREDKQQAMPFYLSLVGLSVYVLRFFSAQIFERVSYYFVFFLMILLPSTLLQLKPRDRRLISILFVIFAIALYAYRISKGIFANYRLTW